MYLHSRCHIGLYHQIRPKILAIKVRRPIHICANVCCTCLYRSTKVMLYSCEVNGRGTLRNGRLLNSLHRAYISAFCLIESKQPAFWSCSVKQASGLLMLIHVPQNILLQLSLFIYLFIWRVLWVVRWVVYFFRINEDVQRFSRWQTIEKKCPKKKKKEKRKKRNYRKFIK